MCPLNGYMKQNEGSIDTENAEEDKQSKHKSFEREVCCTWIKGGGGV